MNQNATILFVDDEPRVLFALELALHASPFQKRFAGGGSEALDILENEPIDVVVTDEEMPGICGSRLLSIVATLHPEAMRILLTGHATVASAIRAINEGKIFRFLEKPCSADKLLEVLTEALMAQESTRAGADLLRIFNQQHGMQWPPSPPSTQMRLRTNDLEKLSLREQEVAQLIVHGRRVKQIAGLLFISPHTVRNHLKSIFHKLEIHSQDELAAKASAA